MDNKLNPFLQGTLLPLWTFKYTEPIDEDNAEFNPKEKGLQVLKRVISKKITLLFPARAQRGRGLTN